MELGRQINQAAPRTSAQTMVSWDLATTVSPSPQAGARPIAMKVLHPSDLKSRVKATAPLVKRSSTIPKALGLTP